MFYRIIRRASAFLSFVGLFVSLSAGATNDSQSPAKARSIRTINLVKDFHAGANSNDITESLQKAVDELTGGGGTIVIPGRKGGWQLHKPIFIASGDITIQGEGSGTWINGTNGTMFLVGVRPQYEPTITEKHFVPIGGSFGWLDRSINQPRYGLRTFDGRTAASGYFTASPLSLGSKIPRDPGGDYWKEYAMGTGKPTFWANSGQYTINLAVLNNTDEPMAGTICGVGPGGVSPRDTRGDIDDPLNIWTIQSDPATGKNLCFKFKVVGPDGKTQVQSLALAADTAGRGMHRISVQLDFSTGKCRSWHSHSTKDVVSPVLTGKLDLPPAAMHMQAFEFGAFRLGRVTTDPFSGSPSDGKGRGDWTYCGLSLFESPRYAIGGEADRPGAPQHAAVGTGPLDDAYRFFPKGDETSLLTFLPLLSGDAQVTVPFQDGRAFDGGRGGLGFWMPSRKVAPIAGTATLRDIFINQGGEGSGIAIVVGEMSHVVLDNLQNYGGCTQTIGSLNCGLTDGILEVHSCRILGSDSSLYCHSMTLKADNLGGGGGETMIRLVGCRGYVDNAMVTGFVKADYYVKIHAGAVGGPLRFSQFCVDNEGSDYVPLKAVFYAEPSLDGGPKGNLLHIAGALYTGSLIKTKAVLELAAAPGISTVQGRGNVFVDGIDLWFPKEKINSVVLTSTPNWTGTVMAQDSWNEHVQNGLVHSATAEPSKVLACQESYSLPTQGTWTAGCNVVRIPDRRDATTGAWTFKTYRCSRSGVYGTANEPKWEEIEALKR